MVTFFVSESKHALEDIPNETDVKYGSQDGEKMDLFFCKNDRKEQIGRNEYTIKSFSLFLV